MSVRKLRAVAVFGTLSLMLACGGGSGGNGGGGGGGGGGVAGCTTGTGTSASGNTVAASAPNVAAIVVDGGINGVPYVNGVFTTVRVCIPGPAPQTCQTIDHVLVDTGSYGLRLLQGPTTSTPGGELTLALPRQTDGVGNFIAECAQFSDGITWGSVRMADVFVGGEEAPNIPVQLIGDSSTQFATVPTACKSFGTPEDALSSLLANGIIGVGPFPQDCGDACAPGTTSNAGLYYACNPSAGCGSSSQPTVQPLASQVQNPVAMFTLLSGATVPDNNGDIVELPSIPGNGLAVVNGSLVFGIGTQSNNGLGKAKIYTGDSSANITTQFAGQTFVDTSFIDSGSNGYFFNFPAGTNVATCSASAGFYCPVSGTQPITLACSASNVGLNKQTGSVNFNVANLDALPGSSAAFNNIAGPNTPPPGSSGPTGFDWGMPFFYGRNVFTGMAGASMPTGIPPGPFYAY
jgi:Protein of unknown function (DUF3443)